LFIALFIVIVTQLSLVGVYLTKQTDTHLVASFPGQPGWAGTWR